MQKLSFEEAISLLIQEDRRYAPESYLFLREALDYTMKGIVESENGKLRHVTGRELLEGIRRYALQEFGPLARTVLETWGIKRTDDFGELVFHLVDKGVLGKTEQDRKEDFAGLYSFDDAFARPFRPSGTAPAPLDKPDRCGGRKPCAAGHQEEA